MLHPSPIFQTVFTALQWLAPLLGLAMLAGSPWFKGLLGKGLLHLAVKLQLDDERYRLIRNVVLPAGGGMARIDHIIVSRHGLFVATISTEQGRIYGRREEKTWRRRLYPARQSFPNPLQRSHQQARALAAALGIATTRIFPLVVFVGDTRFKTQLPANVIHGSGYIRYIESKTDELLSEAEVARIVQKLELLRQNPSRESFVAQAWQGRGPAVKAVDAKPAGKRCPRCGGAMVMHSSKKLDEEGKQFWGCASFPHCKGVLEVTSVPLRDTESTSRFSDSGILPSGA